MAKIFYQQDCDLHKLDGKTVAVPVKNFEIITLKFKR